jgi:probable HAF family extracellular repeat protein
MTWASVTTSSTAVAQSGHSYFFDLNTKRVLDLGAGVRAMGINDSGQVVGIRGSRGFITGPNGNGMTDIGTPGTQAFGINNAGQVVGEENGLAFATGPNGQGISSLGNLGGPSFAYDINEAGQVVGRSWLAGGSFVFSAAFIKRPGESMTALPGLGGYYRTARAINDSGQVVGYSQITSLTAFHAFMTGSNGQGIFDLGTLNGVDSYATAINQSGQVVGWYRTRSGASRAFITGPNGQDIRELQSLRSALDINDLGQVVGISREETAHAVLINADGTGLTDLHALMNISPVGAQRGVEQLAINNRGQVVIGAAIPEPSIYALMVVGLAFVGYAAVRRPSSFRHY